MLISLIVSFKLNDLYFLIQNQNFQMGPMSPLRMAPENINVNLNVSTRRTNLVNIIHIYYIILI